MDILNPSAQNVYEELYSLQVQVETLQRELFARSVAISQKDKMLQHYMDSWKELQKLNTKYFNLEVEYNRLQAENLRLKEASNSNNGYIYIEPVNHTYYLDKIEALTRDKGALQNEVNFYNNARKQIIDALEIGSSTFGCGCYEPEDPHLEFDEDDEN